MQQSNWGPIITDPVGIASKSATRTQGACPGTMMVLREGVFTIASGFYDIRYVDKSPQLRYSVYSCDRLPKGSSGNRARDDQ